MTWLLMHNGVAVATGTREAMLETAEAARVLFHTRPGVDGKPFTVEGRGYYADGCERPARLARGFAIVPAVTVRRRRAA